MQIYIWSLSQPGQWQEAFSAFQHQHHDVIKFVSLNNQAKTGAVPQAPADISPQEDEREKGMLSFSLRLPLL